MAKATKNFKSASALHKWEAYGHIHGDFARSPGNTPVSIKGKSHAVQHGSTVGHKGASTGNRSSSPKGAKH